jgi:hypothetical protein
MPTPNPNPTDLRLGPTMALRFQFAKAACLVGEWEVVTVFEDETVHLLNIRKGDNDHYRGIARVVGYGGDWKRYARHHDLTHNWLADIRGGYSEALWAAAHRTGESFVPEELWVNSLQALWAQTEPGDREIAAAREALGERWQDRFVELALLLSGVD